MIRDGEFHVKQVGERTQEALGLPKRKLNTMRMLGTRYRNFACLHWLRFGYSNGADSGPGASHAHETHTGSHARTPPLACRNERGRVARL